MTNVKLSDIIDLPLFTEDIKKNISNYRFIYTYTQFVYVRYTSNKLLIPIYNNKSLYVKSVKYNDKSLYFNCIKYSMIQIIKWIAQHSLENRIQ